MRQRHRLGSLLALVVASATLTASRTRAAEPAPAPPSTSASSPEVDASLREAEAHHAHGVALYRERRFDAALAEFERAYLLHPDPRLLFTLGQLYYEIGRHARASIALRAYLDQARPAVSEERRTQVERQIDALRALTGYIQISVNASGARVSIDGEDAGISPLPRSILVDVGQHGVTATHPGRAASGVLVLVRPGEMSDASLTLQPLPERARSPLPTVAWITTGGLAALALASAIVTVHRHRDYDEARRNPSDRDPADVQHDLQRQQGRVRTWAVFTDVLTGAAAISGGFALYVSARPDAASPAAPLGPVGSPMGAEIGVTLEF